MFPKASRHLGAIKGMFSIYAASCQRLNRVLTKAALIANIQPWVQRDEGLLLLEDFTFERAEDTVNFKN
ncbi:MAG: hypothetical protein ABJN52_00290 [Litorimonas sp.]